MRRQQNYSLSMKIKMLRAHKNMSQEDLSGIIGISRSSLANYETGKRQPDEEVLSKIAEACHVSVDFFENQPIFRRTSCCEQGRTQSQKLKELIQNHGNSLDISLLPLEQKISMLAYYDYIVAKQEEKIKKEHA